MTAPLFTLDGMVSGHHGLDLDDVADHVVNGVDGQLLIALIDVLAMARLASDADLLLVEFVDGSSRALRLCEVLDRDDVYLRLRIEGPPTAEDAGWRAQLWSADSGSSPTVSSIRAVTFVSFVGLE
jgi:hypothetical protein